MSTSPVSPVVEPSRRPFALVGHRQALAEAAALGVVLAVAGWIFSIPLHNATNYDEGNYLAAITDLRHGFVLGKDVYPDQPPGWYILLGLLARVLGNSVTAIRAGMLVIALLGVVGAWAAARRLGPVAALGAAAVLTVTPPYAAQATQIEADTPAVVLALVALALAAWAYRERTSTALAVLSGAALAGAASVKLSALTAVVPFAAIVLLGRRGRAWPLAGAAAVLLAELLAFRNELGPIAHGAVGQHTSALGNAHWSRVDNLRLVRHYFNWHTPATYLLIAAVLALVLLARHPKRSYLAALWLFLPAAGVFVVAMKPLLDHHLVIVSVALALPAGASLGLAAESGRRELRLGVALLAAALVAVGVAQQGHHLRASRTTEPEWMLRAAAAVRVATAPTDIVATDIPIIAYRAHRLLVPDLVDTSFTRVDVGELPPARIFAELARYHVEVAAIGRSFYADPRIRHGFDVRFRRRLVRPDIVLYLHRRSTLSAP
ncbi:MAG TPA: glycosyltransferase family 39 protein [Gaiellaceae bacterium]|nr:glycosyltransferase family 39 protein [Gaiellaceae bacterium]